MVSWKATWFIIVWPLQINKLLPVNSPALAYQVTVTKMIVITINVSFIKILLGTFYKITAFLCNFALCCISLSYYIPTGHLCVRLQYFMCEISNWKSPVFIIEIQLFYFLIVTVVNSIFQKIIRTKKNHHLWSWKEISWHNAVF